MEDMSNSDINANTVLTRSLGVSTRVTEQVKDLSEGSAGGILLETMLGRYVLDRDASAVWLLLNGRRTVSEIVNALAASEGLTAAQLDQPVRNFCARLTELGLTEAADGASR